MNIVYFVTEDSYFLSHRLPVASYAKNLGHKVYVVTKITNLQKEIEDYGFELIPLNFTRSTLNISNDIKMMFMLIKVLRNISADIIHNVAIKPIIIGSLASLFCRNIKIINAFTGMGFLFTSRLSLKYSLLRFSVWILLTLIVQMKNARSIVQNEADVNFLIKRFHSKKNKICLIEGSGVDVNYFKPLLKRNLKSSKTIRIITTCRMLKDKGILDFYEAALILKNRGVSCKCVFIGGLDFKNPSSISSKTLMNWSDEGVIEYHDHTDNILDLLQNADIYTLVSYREGLSKSILEAASVGLPIVASSIPASKNLVIENKNGFLVSIKNAFELANALEKLVNSGALRSEFGKYSRNIVLESFSEEIISKKTIEFYDSVNA